MEASLRMEWVLGKHNKAFSNAEIMKECMNEVTDAILDWRWKYEIAEKISQIPCSDCTAARNLWNLLTSPIDWLWMTQQTMHSWFDCMI